MFLVGFILVIGGLWMLRDGRTIEGLADTSTVVMAVATGYNTVTTENIIVNGVRRWQNVTRLTSTGVYYADIGLTNLPNWSNTGAGSFKQLSGSMGRLMGVHATENKAYYGTMFGLTGTAFKWEAIPGNVQQISFDYPMVVGLSLTNTVVYITNISSNPTGAVWTPVQGANASKTFRYIAMNNGTAIGAGFDNKIWYCPDVRTPVWSDVSTGLLMNRTIQNIAFDGNDVTVIDSNNTVYFANNMGEVNDTLGSVFQIKSLSDTRVGATAPAPAATGVELTTAARNTVGPRWEVINNQGVQGSDITSTRGTIDQAKALCIATPGCTQFANFNGVNYIKRITSASAAIIPLQGCTTYLLISGTSHKWEVVNNQGVQGSDITQITGTVDEGKIMCTATPGCTEFANFGGVNYIKGVTSESAPITPLQGCTTYKYITANVMPNWRTLTKRMRQISLRNHMAVGVGTDNSIHFAANIKDDSWAVTGKPSGNPAWAELYFPVAADMITFRPALSTPTGYVCNDNEVVQNGVCVSKCPDGSAPDGDICVPQLKVVELKSEAKINCTSSPYLQGKKWMCASSKHLTSLLTNPTPITTYVGPKDQLCVMTDKTTMMYYCMTAAEAVNGLDAITSLETNFAKTCQTITKSYTDLSNNLTNLLKIRTGMQNGSTQLGTAKDSLNSIYSQMNCLNASGNKLNLCNQIKNAASTVGTNSSDVLTKLNEVIPNLQTAVNSRDSLLGYKAKFQCP